jgi:hypothetical protein
MKKYFIEAIIISAVLGMVIRAIVLFLMGENLFSSVESYFFSMVIAMVSCVISVWVHVKVLTSSKIPFITKYMITSLLILFIYLMGNLFFGGWAIIFEAAFYGYALLILLLSWPLIYQLNKRISAYQHFLSVKKLQNGKE